MRENGVQSSENEEMSSQFEPQRELTVFNGARLENELDSHLGFFAITNCTLLIVLLFIQCIS